MNSVSLKSLVWIAIIVPLVACQEPSRSEKSPEEQIEELQAKVGRLEGQIDRLESKFDGVTGSVLKLRNEIEDFGSENWKVNLPEVEYEFEQLSLAVSELGREF